MSSLDPDEGQVLYCSNVTDIMLLNEDIDWVTTIRPYFAKGSYTDIINKLHLYLGQYKICMLRYNGKSEYAIFGIQVENKFKILKSYGMMDKNLLNLMQLLSDISNLDIEIPFTCTESNLNIIRNITKYIIDNSNFRQGYVVKMPPRCVIVHLVLEAAPIINEFDYEYEQKEEDDDMIPYCDFDHM